MEADRGKARPPIPTALKRAVLVEAGHRCAIPACRHTDVDIHHIVPWSRCQEHKCENLVALCPNCHRRADSGEIDRKSLRRYKFNLQFVHDKYSNLEIDILFKVYELPEGKAIHWPPFLDVLINRLLDANLVAIVEQGAGVTVNGMTISPNLLHITADGREFVERIMSEELY